MVLGEGKNPGTGQLTALGKKHSLKSGPEILAHVQAAISRWKSHADKAGLSAKSAKNIGSVILALK